ncbi:MAG: CpaD family pilus assembly protein [Magnetospirillum sp.]|nr:CpaD family pilus assembly protein [Magnetospirillum sp.]
MSRPTAILLALALPVLSGCFPNPDYRDLPNSSVIGHTVGVVATVPVADLAAPTAQERAGVAAALAQAGGNGVRVQVRLPRGEPAPAEAVLRQRLQGLGIDPAIAIVDADNTGGGATLAFLRVTLSAPDCAALVTPSEEWSAGSRPSMAFGCANYTNLTRMLADPADLAAPRAYGGADSTTSAHAVELYHLDRVKKLQKSTAPSVSITVGTE